MTTSASRRPSATTGACDRDRRRVGLQLPQRRLRRGLELGRRRDHTQRRAEAVQHAQHEEVAAEKRVARQPFARLAEHRRDRRRLRHPACDTTGSVRLRLPSASAGSRQMRCAATRDTASARAASRSRRRTARTPACRACGRSRTARTAACARPSPVRRRSPSAWCSSSPASTSYGPNISGRRPCGRRARTRQRSSPAYRALGADLVAQRARDAVRRELVLVGVSRPAARRAAEREDLAARRPARVPSCAPSACGRSRTRPESRRHATGDPASRGARTPASTGRATSWPSSTRATDTPMDTSSPCWRREAVVARQAVVRGGELNTLMGAADRPRCSGRLHLRREVRLRHAPRRPR